MKDFQKQLFQGIQTTSLWIYQLNFSESTFLSHSPAETSLSSCLYVVPNGGTELPQDCGSAVKFYRGQWKPASDICSQPLNIQPVNRQEN